MLAKQERNGEWVIKDRDGECQLLLRNQLTANKGLELVILVLLLFNFVLFLRIHGQPLSLRRNDGRK